MPRGGKRNGAGRKNGSRTQKTCAVAKALVLQGDTPLELIKAVMVYRRDQGDLDGALEAAIAAAPYMHPRLSSAVVKAEVEQETRQIVELIITTREQADETISALSAASSVSRQ